MDNKEIKLQVGVKALLKNKEGKYLLLHRSPIKYPGTDGRWDIVGGRIAKGFTLLDNLKREIKEETNLDLTGRVKLVDAQDILRMEGLHVVRLTYTGEIDGDIVLDEEENDLYKWVTKEELFELEDVDVYLKQLLNNNCFSDL